MLESKKVAGVLIGVAVMTLTLGSLRAEEISYDAGKRRDPFVPLSGDDSAVSATSPSGMKLEGIIYDPKGRSMAVLNGKTYQAGEVVGDATVTGIYKDRVVISVSGEEKTLRLREEEKNQRL